MSETDGTAYRGRLAPSPTGLLHLGHARTFWTAQERCAKHRGRLVLRNEDLDFARCRSEFVDAMIEDLSWFGIRWGEGPDKGGPCAPYSQSACAGYYETALRTLAESGRIFPCTCSRQDVMRSVLAPNWGDEEPVYPGTCHPRSAQPFRWAEVLALRGRRVQWRFRVPEGETVTFMDGFHGPQANRAGVEFGDFVVWRHDWIPSYQLAVVVDDARMSISEVVRGADLLTSTARQILLYRALGLRIPAFYHCPLVLDDSGVRLAKRHDSLSLRALRKKGLRPEGIREDWLSPSSNDRIRALPLGPH